MKRTATYALAGIILAGGAPLGWLLLRLILPGSNASSPLGELRWHSWLYLYLWVGTTIAFGSFGAVLGRYADKLDDMNRRLAALALVDGLTGLKNARYFEERLREETARSARERKTLALILADLDFFKRVNDTYGHPAGDQVLSRTGQAILSCIRAGDSACRLGGEEFAILCPDTDAPQAAAIAERIRAAVAALTFTDMPLSVTISLGIAFHPPCGPDVLVKRADEALYTSKREGRNRVTLA